MEKNWIFFFIFITCILLKRGSVMPEWLFNIDKALFYFFNTTIANPVFDFIMPIITEMKYLIFLYAAFLIYLMIKFKKLGIFVTILAILTVAVSDQISSHLIKKAVGRERPCRELQDVRLLTGCGPGKSFPSSHAVNNFAAALILAYFFRKYRYWIYGVAASIAFSRLYVGVHYPIDVLCGAIIGTAIAALIITLVVKSNILKKLKIEPLQYNTVKGNSVKGEV